MRIQLVLTLIFSPSCALRTEFFSLVSILGITKARATCAPWRAPKVLPRDFAPTPFCSLQAVFLWTCGFDPVASIRLVTNQLARDFIVFS